MKRLLLTFLALSICSLPAWADSVNVTLSPNTQNVASSPGATALLTLTFESTTPTYTGTVSFLYDVLSGPDAGEMATLTGDYTFSSFNSTTPVSDTFIVSNDGVPGTDVIVVILTDTSSRATFTSNTVSVNWTTGVPEPPSVILLTVGLAVLVALWGRRFLLSPL